ncbi:hypothetical protein D0962_20870 [Leptolyngbyaceae cyanobacterium CCMR0082]|uniref:Uncharacterized protein n=2 Tax=Adonisia turfae TaxID=2950184 RepID=A0A6M0S9M0_9CYAN|nr:hypothetical protein [Adonisia turfae]MDV3349809.1 hypothetical protein [Leptothoe sp. LEGE 181152]NEZ58552.1 hypothetical protein [Adonisia turfae CCMR0081]NEZ65198.1 hypothetical protein [Adonisia turfae CCMR0082]
MRKLGESIAEPWIVHVYGQNRKLLWVFDASHGWLFFLGCCTGLLLSIAHFNLARPPATPTPMSDNYSNQKHTPAWQVD